MSYRAGFVGLIGLPNSGKSTLMNAVVGEKVSIVTSKPQTTRRRMVGMISQDDAQIVFVDAPGLVRPTAGLNKFLRQEAEDVIKESDVLIALLNIDEKNAERLDDIIKLVNDSKKPWLALIHKIDLPQMHRPQILREKLAEYNVPIVMGSSISAPIALKETLIERLMPLLPMSEAPLFDEDLYTLSSTRDLCSEIVREKCFEYLHQEIPFGLAVRNLSFKEDEGDTVKIYMEIMVAKDNHRAIVIGREGQILKQIGSAARVEMQKLLGRKVFLDLNVASKKNWTKNLGIMKELGYVNAAT